MPSGKILFTLITVSLVIMAIANMGMEKPAVVENWWGAGQFSTRYMPGMKDKQGNETAFSGNYFDPNAMMGSNKFVSVPSFQSVLSPRFSNVQYGANIRYNMPDRANLGSPCDPLSVGNNMKERYVPPQQQMRQAPPSRENYSACGSPCGSGQCDGNSPPACGKGGLGMGHAVSDGYSVPAGYTNGNYQSVYDSLPSVGFNVGGDVPKGEISTVNELGETEQFMAFSRLMPANTKSSSRLRSQGDVIRGDLAIVPCQSGWFSVYPDIARDVQEGAINVLAGADAGVGSESYSKLMKLVTSAGPSTTFGGVDLSEALPMYNANMAGDNLVTLKAGMSDINVTSFP